MPTPHKENEILKRIGMHCNMKEKAKFILYNSPLHDCYMNPHKERGVFVGIGKHGRKYLIAFKDITLGVYKKDINWLEK